MASQRPQLRRIQTNLYSDVKAPRTLPQPLPAGDQSWRRPSPSFAPLTRALTAPAPHTYESYSPTTPDFSQHLFDKSLTTGYQAENIVFLRPLLRAGAKTVSHHFADVGTADDEIIAAVLSAQNFVYAQVKYVLLRTDDTLDGYDDIACLFLCWSAGTRRFLEVIPLRNPEDEVKAVRLVKQAWKSTKPFWTRWLPIYDYIMQETEFWSSFRDPFGVKDEASGFDKEHLSKTQSEGLYCRPNSNQICRCPDSPTDCNRRRFKHLLHRLSGLGPTERGFLAMNFNDYRIATGRQVLFGLVHTAFGRLKSPSFDVTESSTVGIYEPSPQDSRRKVGLLIKTQLKPSYELTWIVAQFLLPLTIFSVIFLHFRNGYMSAIQWTITGIAVMVNFGLWAYSEAETPAPKMR